MNLTDLADVLRHHAELPVDAAHGPRMAGVRARVRASRRRRVAGVAAGLVAVLGVAFAWTAPAQRESRPAEPAVFSEYHEGTRILAQTSGRAPGSTVALRFVATGRDLRLFTTCESGDQDKQLYSALTVDGQEISGGTCGSPTTLDIDWEKQGIEVGAPVAVAMSVGEQHLAAGHDRTGPTPPGTTFALAVGEVVAPEDYRFPPRPEILAPLRDPGEPRETSNLSGTLVTRSDRDRTNGTWQTTATLPDRPVDITAHANTPGRIRVLVDDVEVLDYASWDYRSTGLHSLRQEHWEESYGLRVRPGDTVTITVVAERTSGDWGVWLVGW